MDKDTLKLRWAEMAEVLWALGGVGGAVSASQKAGQEGRVQGTGPGRLWWEAGCGRRWACWCPALQQGAGCRGEGQSPRRLGGQEAAVRNRGEEGAWWIASPRPCPLPGMCRWAAAGLLEELSPGVLEVRVPEGRVPSDYGGWGLSL